MIATMPKMSSEYGGAMFLLAKDEGLSDELLSSLRTAEAAFTAEPEYIEFLRTPGIPLNERLAAIRQAFDGRVHEYVCSFIELLTERGHIGGFFDCVKEYSRLYYADKSISFADVRSAVPLTSAERTRLIRRLEAMSGHRVELSESVDASLIGGFTVSMDGRLIDGSLRTRLAEIRKDLIS